MTIGPTSQSENGVNIVPTGGCYDCGGRCLHKVHVKDGVAIRSETDDGEEPQLRTCARGRAFRQQVYSPERLRFPLRRTGERGEGKFERISWDEALDTVAGQLVRIKETYGTKAILQVTLGGGTGSIHCGSETLARLLSTFGGVTTKWGNISVEGAVFASRATYGTLTNGNTREDVVNSKLILLWGANPATSIFGTNTSYFLAKAREAGARIVVIDPRYTDTAATFADRWIPVKPGTDTAVMAAMANVMITENLQDQRFLDKYTLGFEKFRDYVMGIEDGLAKTPAWAEAKSGVPADAIVWLAREYAAIKPAALIPGFGPGRTAFGEQYHRMAAVLAAMTGNVGVSGGGAACFERPPIGAMAPPKLARLVEGGDYAARLKQLDVPRRLRGRPHSTRQWDCVLEGTAGGYPVDLKMAYIAFGNPLNQFSNINKGVQALKKLEFVVVHEQFMTPTAKFADILLPASTLWERNDLSRAWTGGSYFLYDNKVVEPPPEVKSDRDICRELASRLGIHVPLLDVPEEDAIRQTAEDMGDVMPEVADYEKFKRDGVVKIKRSAVCFKEQIEDPIHNPFPTLSGKIEIYSQVVADLHNPDIPPIPKHLDPWEGPDDPLSTRCPLQLITPHPKFRAHSCFDNNPFLNNLEPQSLWLNTQDALSRGIGDGDKVRVFNDRGETIIRAKVTDRIMPSVVALEEGAWYQPDEKGRDRGGSPNILTPDRYSPGGAFSTNSALVQVAKFLADT